MAWIVLRHLKLPTGVVEVPMDMADAADEYQSIEHIEFAILASRLRTIPFFSDDIYLGMQATNVGLVDPVVTEMEYDLLREYHEIEKTPLMTAMTVSALSQMWIFGLYEVIRMWRSRRGEFHRLFTNGGVDLKLSSMKTDDPSNVTRWTRRRQLTRYRDEPVYRSQVDDAWKLLEPVYEMVELFRMNLAKHTAPQKDSMIPRAPGYGRINGMCGALDFELLTRDGDYVVMNRRQIADSLRRSIGSMPDSA